MSGVLSRTRHGIVLTHWGHQEFSNEGHGCQPKKVLYLKAKDNKELAFLENR